MGGGSPGTCLTPTHHDTFGSAIDTVVNVHILYITGKAKVRQNIHKSGSSAGGTGRAAPCLNFFKGLFENFDSIIRINFIVINVKIMYNSTTLITKA